MAQALSYGARTRAHHAADGVLARLRKALADHRLYLRTVEELERLSDRELGDLGIHRAQIRETARESVYGG